VLNPDGSLPKQDSGEPGEKVPYDVWRTISYHTFKPLLETKWDQGNPYNMWCPHRYPAGCVAVALAQIVACNEHPAPTRFRSTITKTWDELKAYKYNGRYGGYNGDPPTADSMGYDEAEQTAAIICLIGHAVKMDYGANGSGASTYRAKKFIKKYYSNVDRITLKYDEGAIVGMLTRGRPVYIDSNQGHAWVIDGSRHQMRFRHLYYNGKPTSTAIDYRTLVHCNFGWGGAADGYYERKVFNAHRGPVERESGLDDPNAGNHGKKSANYTRSFNIITYR
jgi:hypothetical protein